MKHKLIIALAATGLIAQAQSYRESYVNWGPGSTDFASLISSWQPGQQVNEDDNFFVSHQKPHYRFRNAATQVRQNLTEDNDKKLIAWIPVNNVESNALPDGVFDSEVFTMWSYVTHWGNWTCPVGRIPATFTDVAHKNGVAVSGVASIPYGSLVGGSWLDALTAYSKMDATKVAKYFRYHGINGMGYNSEFAGGQTFIAGLRTMHANLVKAAKPNDPLFENVWYDGTNDNSTISFDRGLGSHNVQTFGDGNNVRTSLFFNYNWNTTTLLSSSVTYAKNIKRSPLDLYAGVNMQGNEPATNNWPLLKDYPISIGLWGAHSSNMFWESRGEKGSEPSIKQNTYMQRIERWFTGGTRNPANCPTIISSNKYNADNFQFHGMSSMMSARSSLSWNLSEEPFITYFNLGNGKFFNFAGQRQHNHEWYNLSAQDYLPTWHFWFASKLLGRSASDVPASGLDAEYTWDDAWMGGSTLRIHGSTSNEYLHLFKTEYALQAGDVITFRYKLNKGTAKANLVFTAKGNEAVAINESDYNVLSSKLLADEDVWETRTFTVQGDLAGKTLALVALHFENAADMDLVLGEFSIVRGSSAAPATPVLAKSQTLSYSRTGIDAKLIWNMPNTKAAGEPCYNQDLGVSLFKVYAQQEGHDPVLMGVTTTWADLIYNIPVDVTVPNMRIRYGVGALSLDHKSESPIAWSNYENVSNYTYSDDIEISKTTIKPGEAFSMKYVDPKHESGTWKLIDGSGKTVFTGNGLSVDVTGLSNIGSYDLVLDGYVDNNGSRIQKSRTYSAFVQVSGNGVGALPQIYTFTANGAEANIEVNQDEDVTLAYTGRNADGAGSQGIDLQENRFGATAADLGIVGKQSFSVAFWLKINELASGTTQLLSVANKLDSWPKTDWGWIWCNVEEDGSIGNFTFRGTDATSNNELRYRFNESKLPIGNWVHLGFTFDYNTSGGFKAKLFINGVEQKLTQWNRTKDGDVMTPGQYKTTDPGYQTNVYNITNGQVLAIGGSAHGRNGIKGTVDNLIVWSGAVDASTIKASMGDINPASLANNVTAFWNLEDKASADYTFTSAGQKKIAAGCHSYEATGGEGQGKFHWIESAYTSGCPFVMGTSFPVVTKPEWKYKKATLQEQAGSNGQQGGATIAWKQGGDYNVTLTLRNSLGADSKTFSVITVHGTTPEGVQSVQGGQMQTYVVGDQAVLRFDEGGIYDVKVYNAVGQQVATRTAAISGQQTMQVTLAQPGAYVVRVAKDGQALRSLKLLRK